MNDEDIITARQMLIDVKAATGNRYGKVVETGILSGHWDTGDLIREQLAKLKAERKKK